MRGPTSSSPRIIIAIFADSSTAFLRSLAPHLDIFPQGGHGLAAAVATIITAGRFNWRAALQSGFRLARHGVAVGCGIGRCAANRMGAQLCGDRARKRVRLRQNTPLDEKMSMAFGRNQLVHLKAVLSQLSLACLFASLLAINANAVQGGRPRRIHHWAEVARKSSFDSEGGKGVRFSVQDRWPRFCSHVQVWRRAGCHDGRKAPPPDETGH